MKQRWPALGLALLLVALLVMVATGSVSDLIVVPLLYMFWVARLLYASIPQALLWGGFLAIAVLILWRSLIWRSPPEPARDPDIAVHGRVSAWVRVLNESGRDDHMRWRLAQRLGQLGLETLACKERCAPQEVRHRLEEGSLDMPAELRAYLRAGTAYYAPEIRMRRSWWRAIPFGGRAGIAQRARPLDLDPEQVIQYLEETLQQMIGVSR